MELQFHARHLQLNIEKPTREVSLEYSLEGGQLLKSGRSCSAHREPPDFGVAADNGNPIAGQARVKLKATASMLECKIKGRKRVLSSRAGRP